MEHYDNHIEHCSISAKETQPNNSSYSLFTPPTRTRQNCLVSSRRRCEQAINDIANCEQKLIALAVDSRRPLQILTFGVLVLCASVQQPKREDRKVSTKQPGPGSYVLQNLNSRLIFIYPEQLGPHSNLSILQSTLNLHCFHAPSCNE